MVNIVDEHVEGLYTLFQPSLQPVPLCRAYNPWHHVERQDALAAARVAVDVERDAHEHQVTLGCRLSTLELAIVHRLDALNQRPRIGPGCAIGHDELVVEALCLVVIEVHRYAIINSTRSQQ